MNKCLSVGMDAQMVKKSAGVVVPEQFLDRLKKHKLSLLLSAGRQQNEHEEEEADNDQLSAPVFVPKEGCVVQKNRKQFDAEDDRQLGQEATTGDRLNRKLAI
ncbi:hypothetical protein niasHT_033161 [Heterodera trifolii]|uniref:Uncharacterized protein n=1 Tax=Heterodera trifolii TaxID=157864 RepID=A0ABD2IMY2_9BILA